MRRRVATLVHGRGSAIYLALAASFLVCLPNARSQSGLVATAAGQIGGPSYAIAFASGFVYAGVGPRILVLDATAPGAPVEVGRGPLMPGVVRAVAAAGDLLYVTYGDESDPMRYGGGMWVLDASNKAAPTPIGSIVTSGSALAVEVRGRVAYIADGAGGLLVLDVSNPRSPTKMGGLVADWPAQDLDVVDWLVYVAAGSGGLRVISALDPGRPTELSAYDALADSRDVEVASGYAFVADEDSGLVVVDVTDPYRPVPVSAIDTPDAARGMAIEGETAYMGDALRLSAFDVSRPSTPERLGEIQLRSWTEHIVVSAGRAYVAGADAGPLVVDFTTPAAPRLEATYLYPSVVSDVAIGAGLTYLAVDDGGLAVVQTGPSGSTSPLARLYTQGRSRAVALGGRRAYLADGSAVLPGDVEVPSALRVVDISDPAGPRETGAADLAGEARDVAVDGSLAYVADEVAGLVVIDVSNPSAPATIAAAATGGLATGVAKRGPRAFVASGQAGLKIFDVTDPAAPTLVGSINAPGLAVDVEVSEDDYAFVLYKGVPDGLAVYDVVDPAAPRIQSATEIAAEVNRLTLDGESVVIACRDDGLWVIDAGSITAPRVAGSFNTVGTSFDVVIAGGAAYVADGDGGLAIVRFEEAPTATHRTPGSVTPTPTRGSPTPGGQRWYAYLPSLRNY